MVGAGYKFRFVDVGANGSCPDSGLFLESELYKGILNENLNIPERAPLPNGTVPIPYFIIGDDAFALRDWMMKPYPLRKMTPQARIFNYRLSRARRVV